MKRVAILISGGGSNMMALVKGMAIHNNCAPVLVASNDPDAQGLARAQGLGIDVALVDHRAFGRDRQGFEAALLAQIDASRPDIVCLAGFMRILSAQFVQTYAGRLLNIHPSLLPKYPGLNTHARALAAGDTMAGCTVHLVTSQLDAGPVLGQTRVPILADDTVQALSARVLVQEHLLYPMVLERFAAGIVDPVWL